jgi:hypothetical protein
LILSENASDAKSLELWLSQLSHCLGVRTEVTPRLCIQLVLCVVIYVGVDVDVRLVCVCVRERERD